eukprot:TRINITY_DN2467_c0_g4_i1.p1 TRINITY_DN2467_c0_g4~~TRINITY_DN2467_c0_g4_i1.p1  ORF type:complete len:618 (+),score=107.26 TRINITY_DN2467_c0_g4_i1:112-1854(+)
MDALVASWASWTAKAREAVLKVEDPKIIGLLDMTMRNLWTEELHARQFGVASAVQPFDHSRLPLLASMQFDSRDGYSRVVKWPDSFCEDPLALPGALSLNLYHEGSAASRTSARRLQPQQWQSLFNPPAKSWLGFERQLAKLVEQLVLHACGAAETATAAAGPTAAAGSDGEVEGEEAQGGEEAGASTELTSRAAKRLRQRERRRMGKAAARASMGGGAPDAEGVAVEAPAPAPAPVRPQAVLARLAMEPVRVETTESRLAGAAEAVGVPGTRPDPRGVGRSGNAPTTPQAATVAPWAPKTAPDRPGALAAGAAAASPSPLSEPAVVEAPAKVTAATAHEGTAAGVPAVADQLDDEEEGEEKHKPDLPMLAGFAGVARGIGRGRPIGGLFGAMRGDNLMPHGRGRALAPPPGLRGPPSLKMAGGLSQPWMPGPAAIPEDDEDREVPQRADDDSVLGGAWLPLELTTLDPAHVRPGAGTSVDCASSYWSASYVATPVMGWAKTPSSPGGLGTPLECLGVPPSRSDIASNDSPQLAPSIPTYVTVPLALAHSCPHCGCRFAFPSPDLGEPMIPLSLEKYAPD